MTVELRKSDEDTTNMKRLTFTLPPALISKIDQLCQTHDMNRSQIVRRALDHWLGHSIENRDLSGVGVSVINYRYNHNERRVVEELMDIQREYNQVITSTTHVHLSDNSCFELIICNGKLETIWSIAKKLQAVKGISGYSENYS